MKCLVGYVHIYLAHVSNAVVGVVAAVFVAVAIKNDFDGGGNVLLLLC